MSYIDYRVSQEIALRSYPFYALIMAAMRQADSNNLRKLERAFPDVFQEIMGRYDAPLGLLESDPESLRVVVMSDDVDASEVVERDVRRGYEGE